MNLIQVLALALSFTALAVVLGLRFTRLGQLSYIYGTIALGFLGGICFGIIFRLHDILASWSVNLFLDVILIIFVGYALSLCYEEIAYHRQHEPLAIPAEKSPRIPVASQHRHDAD